MNAELYLLGKRIDMGPLLRRRALVAAIYLFCAVWIAVICWMSVTRHDAGYLTTGGIWLFIVVWLLNILVLGGKVAGGLVKPFVSRRTAASSPVLLILFLRWGRTQVPDPRPSEFLSDERELDVARRAHFLAYRGIAGALMVVWAAAFSQIAHRNLFAWIPMPGAQLVCALAWISLLLCYTLPQAILLWTEPDMEPEV